MLETEDKEVLDDAASTERRMRRALGLDGSGRQGTLTVQTDLPKRITGEHATPRRSCQKSDARSDDAQRSHGGSPLQARVETLEQQLAAERQRHEEARHLVQQTELRHRSFEDRLREGALAQSEELDAARRATANAQRALDEVLFEATRQQDAQRSARTSKLTVAPRVPARDTSNTPISTEPGTATSASPPSEVLTAKKRGRPRTRLAPEPKPVRWWTPSFKARTKD